MRDTVDKYFSAMQRGADARDELLSLFSDDAVYVEPFTGRTRTHAGRDAIRRELERSQAQAPPDLRLVVDSLSIDGETVETDWTCESPLFERPARGRDRFTIRDGRIARLETAIVEEPELRGDG
jgi:ketosteroid isomerase-like protein